MDIQDLVRLEEKIEALLQYCSELKSERDTLLARTAEQAEKIKELERRVEEFESERDDVKNRVSNILSKLETLDMSESQSSEGPLFE